MKKLLTLIFMLIIVTCANAKTIKHDFSGVINDSDIEKNAISISIKDLNTGKAVYELNEKRLTHPASVQKILTLISAIDTLGESYEFNTILYIREDNSYILKLGADPYLTSSDLKELTKNIKPEVKTIYIDDSIIEKKDWGEGWQWDDDLNILMPKFNSYNLDKNLLKITILPTKQGELSSILNTSKYPLVFLNNVTTEDNNNIKISRDNSVSANTLSFNGTINKPVGVYIPIGNLKRYFNIKLTNALTDNKIYLKQNFIIDKVKASDKEVARISHPISSATNEILKNSNNMISETVNKLAGEDGTDISGIITFKNYCKKINLDTNGIRLVDASGVSKNNLVSADFISEFLIKNKDNKTLTHLPSPGQGTLTHRMLPLKDSLKAKTGTLSDISSIAGYLTTKKGNHYAFCIMINDPASTSSDKKTLEDYIIREAYLRL